MHSEKLFFFCSGSKNHCNTFITASYYPAFCRPYRTSVFGRGFFLPDVRHTGYYLCAVPGHQCSRNPSRTSGNFRYSLVRIAVVHDGKIYLKQRTGCPDEKYENAPMWDIAVESPFEGPMEKEQRIHRTHCQKDMCFERYYPTAYIEIYNYIMQCRQPATRIVVHSPSPERNRPAENNRRQILFFRRNKRNRCTQIQFLPAFRTGYTSDGSRNVEGIRCFRIVFLFINQKYTRYL